VHELDPRRCWLRAEKKKKYYKWAANKLTREGIWFFKPNTFSKKNPMYYNFVLFLIFVQKTI
jgi:hypothetical protein